MKKNTLLLVASILFIGLVFIGCAPKENSCSELLNDVSTTATVFGNNPSEASCSDYKAAIRAYLDGCPTVPSISRESYETIASIDCTVYQ